MAKLMRKYRPDLYDQLAAAQKCCVCDKYFISTCIECVHYINTKKVRANHCLKVHASV